MVMDMGTMRIDRGGDCGFLECLGAGATTSGYGFRARLINKSNTLLIL